MRPEAVGKQEPCSRPPARKKGRDDTGNSFITRIENLKNKAEYTAQDAPSTRLKITRDGQTYGPTDGPTDGRTDGHTLL